MIGIASGQNKTKISLILLVLSSLCLFTLVAGGSLGIEMGSNPRTTYALLFGIGAVLFIISYVLGPRATKLSIRVSLTGALVLLSFVVLGLFISKQKYAALLLLSLVELLMLALTRKWKSYLGILIGQVILDFIFYLSIPWFNSHWTSAPIFIQTLFSISQSTVIFFLLLMKAVPTILFWITGAFEGKITRGKNEDLIANVLNGIFSVFLVLAILSAIIFPIYMIVSVSGEDFSGMTPSETIEVSSPIMSEFFSETYQASENSWNFIQTIFSMFQVEGLNEVKLNFGFIDIFAGMLWNIFLRLPLVLPDGTAISLTTIILDEVFFFTALYIIILGDNATSRRLFDLIEEKKVPKDIKRGFLGAEKLKRKVLPLSIVDIWRDWLDNIQFFINKLGQVNKTMQKINKKDQQEFALRLAGFKNNFMDSLKKMEFAIMLDYVLWATKALIILMIFIIIGAIPEILGSFIKNSNIPILTNLINSPINLSLFAGILVLSYWLWRSISLIARRLYSLTITVFPSIIQYFYNLIFIPEEVSLTGLATFAVSLLCITGISIGIMWGLTFKTLLLIFGGIILVSSVFLVKQIKNIFKYIGSFFITMLIIRALFGAVESSMLGISLFDLGLKEAALTLGILTFYVVWFDFLVHFFILISFAFIRLIFRKMDKIHLSADGLIDPALKDEIMSSDSRSMAKSIRNFIKNVTKKTDDFSRDARRKAYKNYDVIREGNKKYIVPTNKITQQVQELKAQTQKVTVQTKEGIKRDLKVVTSNDLTVVYDENGVPIIKKKEGALKNLGGFLAKYLPDHKVLSTENIDARMDIAPNKDAKLPTRKKMLNLDKTIKTFNPGSRSNAEDKMKIRALMKQGKEYLNKENFEKLKNKMSTQVGDKKTLRQITKRRLKKNLSEEETWKLTKENKTRAKNEMIHALSDVARDPSNKKLAHQKMADRAFAQNNLINNLEEGTSDYDKEKRKSMVISPANSRGNFNTAIAIKKDEPKIPDAVSTNLRPIDTSEETKLIKNYVLSGDKKELISLKNIIQNENDQTKLTQIKVDLGRLKGSNFIKNVRLNQLRRAAKKQLKMNLKNKRSDEVNQQAKLMFDLKYLGNSNKPTGKEMTKEIDRFKKMLIKSRRKNSRVNNILKRKNKRIGGQLSKDEEALRKELERIEKNLKDENKTINEDKLRNIKTKFITPLTVKEMNANLPKVKHPSLPEERGFLSEEDKTLSKKSLERALGVVSTYLNAPKLLGTENSQFKDFEANVKKLDVADLNKMKQILKKYVTKSDENHQPLLEQFKRAKKINNLQKVLDNKIKSLPRKQRRQIKKGNVPEPNAVYQGQFVPEKVLSKKEQKGLEELNAQQKARNKFKEQLEGTKSKFNRLNPNQYNKDLQPVFAKGVRDQALKDVDKKAFEVFDRPDSPLFKEQLEPKDMKEANKRMKSELKKKSFQKYLPSVMDPDKNLSDEKRLLLVSSARALLRKQMDIASSKELKKMKKDIIKRLNITPRTTSNQHEIKILGNLEQEIDEKLGNRNALSRISRNLNERLANKKRQAHEQSLIKKIPSRKEKEEIIKARLRERGTKQFEETIETRNAYLAGTGTSLPTNEVPKTLDETLSSIGPTSVNTAEGRMKIRALLKTGKDYLNKGEFDILENKIKEKISPNEFKQATKRNWKKSLSKDEKEKIKNINQNAITRDAERSLSEVSKNIKTKRLHAERANKMFIKDELIRTTESKKQDSRDKLTRSKVAPERFMPIDTGRGKELLKKVIANEKDMKSVAHLLGKSNTLTLYKLKSDLSEMKGKGFSGRRKIRKIKKALDNELKIKEFRDNLFRPVGTKQQLSEVLSEKSGYIDTSPVRGKDPERLFRGQFEPNEVLSKKQNQKIKKSERPEYGEFGKLVQYVGRSNNIEEIANNLSASIISKNLDAETSLLKTNEELKKIGVSNDQIQNITKMVKNKLKNKPFVKRIKKNNVIQLPPSSFQEKIEHVELPSRKSILENESRGRLKRTLASQKSNFNRNNPSQYNEEELSPEFAESRRDLENYAATAKLNKTLDRADSPDKDLKHVTDLLKNRGPVKKPDVPSSLLHEPPEKIKLPFWKRIGRKGKITRSKSEFEENLETQKLSTGDTDTTFKHPVVTEKVLPKGKTKRNLRKNTIEEIRNEFDKMRPKQLSFENTEKAVNTQVRAANEQKEEFKKDLVDLKKLTNEYRLLKANDNDSFIKKKFGDSKNKFSKKLWELYNKYPEQHEKINASLNLSKDNKEIKKFMERIESPLRKRRITAKATLGKGNKTNPDKPRILHSTASASESVNVKGIPQKYPEKLKEEVRRKQKIIADIKKYIKTNGDLDMEGISQRISNINNKEDATAWREIINNLKKENSQLKLKKVFESITNKLKKF